MTNFYIPTAQEIQSFQIGDLAPNSLSKEWQPITEIFARDKNVNGQWYICYYTRLRENSTISHSLVEDKLDRTIWTSRDYTSHELDKIEKQLLKEKKK
jgi:hypothetical protein